MLNEGVQRTIGTDADTSVWNDVWIPDTPARPAKPINLNYDPDLRVHHLIDFDLKEWNTEFTSEVIDAADLPRILKLKISRTGRHDGYRWEHSKSGHYTVRFGYSIAVEQRREKRSAR